MVVADATIAQAFIDGINEAFSIMFTDKIYLKLLKNPQPINIYKENVNKVFEDPVDLVGGIVLSNVQGSKDSASAFKTALQSTDDAISATIKIPTKQFMLKNIDVSDLKIFLGGVFSYKGFDYEIKSANYTTMVADVWQIYLFRCDKLRKESD